MLNLILYFQLLEDNYFLFKSWKVTWSEYSGTCCFCLCSWKQRWFSWGMHNVIRFILQSGQTLCVPSSGEKCSTSVLGLVMLCFIKQAGSYLNWILYVDLEEWKVGQWQGASDSCSVLSQPDRSRLSSCWPYLYFCTSEWERVIHRSSPS